VEYADIVGAGLAVCPAIAGFTRFRLKIARQVFCVRISINTCMARGFPEHASK